MNLDTQTLIGILTVVATIAGALIQKTWRLHRRGLPHHEGLEYGPVRESQSFSASDVVKVLDLRLDSVSKPAPLGLATFTDSYLLHRESLTGNGAVFRYATRGQLRGDSVSHPNTHIAGEYKSGHFNASLVVAVPLENLSRRQTERVTNRLIYSGAFDRKEGEDFETHIERPTRSLTIFILFASERRCISATGKVQIGERGVMEDVRVSGPIVINDGSVVYWHIPPNVHGWLPVGAKYHIQWAWDSKQATT